MIKKGISFITEYRNKLLQVKFLKIVFTLVYPVLITGCGLFLKVKYNNNFANRYTGYDYHGMSELKSVIQITIIGDIISITLSIILLLFKKEMMKDFLPLSIFMIIMLLLYKKIMFVFFQYGIGRAAVLLVIICIINLSYIFIRAIKEKSVLKFFTLLFSNPVNYISLYYYIIIKSLSFVYAS